MASMKPAGEIPEEPGEVDAAAHPHTVPPANPLIVEALAEGVRRVRNDEDLTTRAKRLLERDRELLERLATT